MKNILPTTRSNAIAQDAVETALARNPSYIDGAGEEFPAEEADLRQDLFIAARSIITACVDDDLSDDEIYEKCVSSLLRWMSAPYGMRRTARREARPISITPVPSPETFLTYQQMLATISAALQSLPPLWERVMRLRYGFEPSDPHSIDEVAKLLFIDPDQVARIEKLSVSLLRHSNLTPRLISCLPDTANEYDEAFATLRLLRCHIQISRLEYPVAQADEIEEDLRPRIYSSLEDVDGVSEQINDVWLTALVSHLASGNLIPGDVQRTSIEPINIAA